MARGEIDCSEQTAGVDAMLRVEGVGRLHPRCFTLSGSKAAGGCLQGSDDTAMVQRPPDLRYCEAQGIHSSLDVGTTLEAV